MTKINKIIILAIAGVLFSGYLSAVKLFSQTCAIDTGCSYFLGYPTCYYGFSIFTLILIAALANKFCKWGGKKMQVARLHALRSFAAVGIVFSAYFSFIEIGQMISKKIVYGALIMPTCFYGLIFYIWVMLLAMKIKVEKQDTEENASTENKLEEGGER